MPTTQLPTEAELWTLEKSVVSADPTGKDYVLKDLKKQIDKVCKKVRKYKKSQEKAPLEENTCRVCFEPTQTVFNINLNAVNVCENCASNIFMQQARWYTEQK